MEKFSYESKLTTKNYFMLFLKIWRKNVWLIFLHWVYFELINNNYNDFKIKTIGRVTKFTYFDRHGKNWSNRFFWLIFHYILEIFC